MSRPVRPGPALALLSAINLLNFADRFVLGGVQELIKNDVTFTGGARSPSGALSDASLGVLTTVFVVVFMLAAPVTGWLGDRVARKWLVAGGAVVWSLATLGSAHAHTFTELVVARAFIGAGEAGYATVAPSLIADLLPPERRGGAMGLYNLVMPLGAAVGFGVGGVVGARLGWRAAFLVAGVPGLALALAYLLLPEPRRGSTDADAPERAPLSWADTLRALLQNRDFVLNTAGQVLLTFTVGGLANWMPSFLVRSVGMTSGEAGTSFGVLTASAGVLGTIAGTIAGEWARKRMVRGYFWIAGSSLIVAAPCVLAMAWAPGKLVTLGATFLALFFVLFNAAPLFTALVNAVPASLRASAVAFNLLAIHVLGDAISPPLVGIVSDATGNLAIAVAACALPLLAGGLLLLGAARAPQAAGDRGVEVNCA